MLKILFSIPLLFIFLNANIVKTPSYSFITEGEYGEMLYKNPRGIGCDLCHGIDGKGKFIASYKHKGENIQVSAPNIIGLDFKHFKNAINKNKSKSIMPKYFLTDEEINSIYHYLKTK